MKKKVFTQPISLMLSVDMFAKVEKITIEKEISFSEFIRECIELKLHSMDEFANDSGK